MKLNPALAMALSALSAGILISCVKPAEENKAPEVDSQVAQDKTATTSADDNNGSAVKVTAVDVSAETGKTYLSLSLIHI